MIGGLGHQLQHEGRFYGKHSGVVVEGDDDEKIKRGWVKATVPAVLAELEVWARPCVPYGHFFVPPTGTKLWVEFEGGDPHYPIWVGTWFADGEAPEETPDNAPDNRVIQTASGHTVELDDTEGEERLVVRHKLDSFLSVDKEGSVLLANQKGSHVYLNAKDEEVTVMSQHGHLVTFTGDGLLLACQDGTTLELTGGKLKVNAAGGIQLVGDQVSVAAGSILLGGANATGHVMVADKFIPQFMAHTHVTAVGPTGPPLPPVVPPSAPFTSVASQSVRVGM